MFVSKSFLSVDLISPRLAELVVLTHEFILEIQGCPTDHFAKLQALGLLFLATNSRPAHHFRLNVAL